MSSQIESESQRLANKAIAGLADALDEQGEDGLFVEILRRAAKLLLSSPKMAAKILRLWTPIRKVDVVFLPNGDEGVDIRLISPDDRRN